MNQQAKNVADYYVLCNKLKHIIRTGWKDWHVNRERIESVAEHVFRNSNACDCNVFGI